MQKELIINKTEDVKYTCSLAEMIEQVDKEPKPVMVYSGIKEGSVGFVFGPSKSGKTIFCEALGMSIAAGASSFLNKPIVSSNNKVMFMSLEEHSINRTERNKLQLDYIAKSQDSKWLNNYIVIKDMFPRYIETVEQWGLLKKAINANKPGVVIIDSLTHLYAGSIEDSKVAKEVMKKLRALADETKATVICIHHTRKMNDKPIDINTLAGSRVIAQEADFLIGINRNPKGVRYIKEVAFRYKANETETVSTFSINENCWPELAGTDDEFKLLAVGDGRIDDANRSLIMEYYEERNDDVTAKELETEFVTPGTMSRQTLFTSLSTLVSENKLMKVKKGIYKKAA